MKYGVKIFDLDLLNFDPDLLNVDLEPKLLNPNLESDWLCTILLICEAGGVVEVEE